MKPVVRIGDHSMGEAQFPPTTLAEGSPNVFVNSKPVGNVGAKWVPHTRKVKPFDTHVEVCVAGSSTVFINSKPICRIGDGLLFGDIIIEGSSNVFSG